MAARAGSSLRLLCIPIGVLALVSLVLPKGAPGAPAPVSFTLTGTAGSNGWHTSNVTIRWTVEPTDLVDTSGCPAAELITAEGASTRQCIATFTWGTVTSPVVTVRIDKTPPTAPVANPARGPDSNGWYNRSVGVGFSATDAVSGMGSCTGGAYSGPDSATASVTGICTDVAGNTRAGAFSLQYDSTAPGVAAAASRAPDANGWYNRSLTVSFSQSPGDVSGARHLQPGRLVQRARLGHGGGVRHLHRPGREHERAARVRAEVRRDGAAGARRGRPRQPTRTAGSTTR